VHRLEDLPRIVRRAAKVATTPPTGPVFISLPGDILNDEAGIDLGQSTRVDTASRPSDAALSALCGRLLAAKKPVIIAGHEIVTSDALAEAARFAEALGAPVYQQTVPYGSHFLSEHPAFMGGLTRSQQHVRDTLEPYDLLVVLGADVLRMSIHSEIDPLPADMPVVQIGQNDWEMGKNYASETALRGDVKETLAALTPLLSEQGGAAHQEVAESRIAALADGNWTARRAARRIATREKQDAAEADAPIAGDWLMLQTVEAMPDNAVLVNEGITTAASLLSFYPYRERYDFHGLASGGIGWGIAAAVGVSLAHRDRPTVAVIGDGSAMYSIQALWTAANMKLPLTYVICNNKGYRIIKQRLKAFHGNEHYIGMDFLDPEIDFVQLAQGLGMTAQRITAADDVRPALDAAIASGKPNLLDVVVDRTV
jgi:benzoylformate decarboxylase